MISPSNLTHLIHTHPEAARKQILDALRKSGMHKGEASKLLSIAHPTLLRYIAALRLADEIDRLVEVARREGWHHGRIGGRPAGATPVRERRAAAKRAAGKQARSRRRAA